MRDGATKFGGDAFVVSTVHSRTEQVWTAKWNIHNCCVRRSLQKVKIHWVTGLRATTTKNSLGRFVTRSISIFFSARWINVSQNEVPRNSQSQESLLSSAGVFSASHRSQTGLIMVWYYDVRKKRWALAAAGEWIFSVESSDHIFFFRSGMKKAENYYSEEAAMCTNVDSIGMNVRPGGHSLVSHVFDVHLLFSSALSCLRMFE